MSRDPIPSWLYPHGWPQGREALTAALLSPWAMCVVLALGLIALCPHRSTDLDGGFDNLLGEVPSGAHSPWVVAATQIDPLASRVSVLEVDCAASHGSIRYLGI